MVSIETPGGAELRGNAKNQRQVSRHSGKGTDIIVLTVTGGAKDYFSNRHAEFDHTGRLLRNQRRR